MKIWSRCFYGTQCTNIISTKLVYSYGTIIHILQSARAISMTCSTLYSLCFMCILICIFILSFIRCTCCFGVLVNDDDNIQRHWHLRYNSQRRPTTSHWCSMVTKLNGQLYVTPSLSDGKFIIAIQGRGYVLGLWLKSSQWAMSRKYVSISCIR